ncbi:MAG: hypothetical protein M1820_007523 [Bogoriella megaspora]|nr:MAG: hypothetical protein M1820_007523 [Bogoriella megaspora]
MTKKKRGPDLDELLKRPFCYYCERDFDDDRVLMQHQKAKHYKCARCNRRLNTAGGLSVHMTQVHKETINEIENALPTRTDPNIEIFGTVGIPEDVVESRRQRIIQEYYQKQAEHAAASGNPLAGAGASGGNPNPAKKPKIEESTADLKKRLAEHKARKAAQAKEGSSGDVTPGQDASQSPAPFSPSYAQQTFAAPTQAAVAQAAFQPYGQPPPLYGQPSPVPGFQAPQSSYVHTPPQPFSAFAPPGSQPFPQGQPYTPPQQYPNAGVPLHQGAPQGLTHDPSTSYQYPPQGAFQRLGALSPPVPPPNSQYQTPPHHASHQQASYQNGNSSRPVSLQPASGLSQPAASLPPRPQFGAPQVNAFQMQQLHQGHIPGQNGVGNSPGQQPRKEPNEEMQRYLNGEQATQSANATSLDDLIANASKVSERRAIPETGVNGTKEVKEGKEKGKPTKMALSEQVSPEENMADLTNYAFTPTPGLKTVLGDITGKQTGPVDETLELEPTA